jgi:muramoyltetrapeptide carboxypeptidase
VDAIGTSSDPDTNGKILILEEIDEYFYKVDRMVMHLRRSGKLDNLAGLIVGHMTDMKDPKLPFGETIQEIILSKTQHTKYPIAFGFPIGHENPNIAWVHGSVMTLTVNETTSQLSPVY